MSKDVYPTLAAFAAEFSEAKEVLDGPRRVVGTLLKQLGVIEAAGAVVLLQAFEERVSFMHTKHRELKKLGGRIDGGGPLRPEHDALMKQTFEVIEQIKGIFDALKREMAFLANRAKVEDAAKRISAKRKRLAAKKQAMRKIRIARRRSKAAPPE